MQNSIIRQAVIDLKGKWPSKTKGYDYLIRATAANSFRPGEYDCSSEVFNCDFIKGIYEKTPWEDICTREQFEEEIKNMKSGYEVFEGDLNKFVMAYIYGVQFYYETDKGICKLPDNIKAVDLKDYHEQSILYTLPQKPWWKDYINKPIMVRDINILDWKLALFVGYDSSPSPETSPFICADDTYRYGRPMTKAERNALPFEG